MGLFVRKDAVLLNVLFDERLALGLAFVLPRLAWSVRDELRSLGRFTVIKRTNPNRAKWVAGHVLKRRMTDLLENGLRALKQPLGGIVAALGAFEHHDAAKRELLVIGAGRAVPHGKAAYLIGRAHVLNQ